MLGKWIEKICYSPTKDCTVDAIIERMFSKETGKPLFEGCWYSTFYMKKSNNENTVCFTLSSLVKRSNARKFLSVWKDLTMLNRVYFRLDTYLYAWVEYDKENKIFCVYHGRNAAEALPRYIMPDFRDIDAENAIHRKEVKTEFDVIWYLFSTNPKKLVD